jgi:hypothetical protein
MTDDTDTQAHALELLERFGTLPDAEPEPEKPSITISRPEGMTREQALAHVASDPETQAAMNLSLWSQPADGERPEIAPLVEMIHQRVEQIIESGSLEGVETMLVTQAITLQAVGDNLLRRASLATHLKSIEVFTKLGLRAFSQCRANIEALATIERPALKQTNIANGPQQVNNHLGNSKSPSKLSTVESDPPLAALEPIDRAENCRRKSAGEP